MSLVRCHASQVTKSYEIPWRSHVNFICRLHSNIVLHLVHNASYTNVSCSQQYNFMSVHQRFRTYCWESFIIILRFNVHCRRILTAKIQLLRKLEGMCWNKLTDRKWLGQSCDKDRVRLQFGCSLEQRVTKFDEELVIMATHTPIELVWVFLHSIHF